VFSTLCPHCGKDLEFWKDEPFLHCRDCGKEVQNPRLDLGCAKWCQFAKACLGRLPEDPDLIAPVRSRLLLALRKALAPDGPRVERAVNVLERAEAIQEAEGGSAVTVKAAALLRGAGLPSDRGRQDGAEAAAQPAARAILAEAGLEPAVVDDVLALVEALGRDGDADDRELKILRDAEQLAALTAADGGGPDAAAPGCGLRTATARRLAEELCASGE